MLDRFAQKVHSFGPCFLVGVSGGMDSMCLLNLFSKVLSPAEFAVAHCNFSLRGKESDGDQALVESYAAALGVRVFVRNFDTESYAEEKGISIEMAARDLRYDWFAGLCQEHGFKAVAIAHNANDNAETLMLNMLRGTGMNGLRGMDEVSVLSGYGVTVFRPMLEFTRRQIEGYVFAGKVPYRHDSSNFESDYKRNRIRNEVFPVFEKINPSFIRTLNREIGYFFEAGSIVEDWCRSLLPSVLIESSAMSSLTEPSVMSSQRSESRRLSINTPALLATPHWRYLLYYILEPFGFNSQTIASIEALLTSGRTVSGKRFESPAHTLLTAQDSLIVVPSAQGDEPGTSDEVMVVRGAGAYDFNGARFRVELIDWTSDMPLKQPAGTLALDADALQFPFVCRRWRQGDWLIPLGMHGKKKVSDLFTDLKFNSLQKDSAVILVDTSTEGLAEQQHVSALLGHRIDDRYKITPSTRRVILIRTL